MAAAAHGKSRSIARLVCSHKARVQPQFFAHHRAATEPRSSHTDNARHQCAAARWSLARRSLGLRAVVAHSRVGWRRSFVVRLCDGESLLPMSVCAVDVPVRTAYAAAVSVQMTSLSLLKAHLLAAQRFATHVTRAADGTWESKIVYLVLCDAGGDRLGRVKLDLATHTALAGAAGEWGESTSLALELSRKNNNSSASSKRRPKLEFAVRLTPDKVAEAHEGFAILVSNAPS